MKPLDVAFMKDTPIEVQRQYYKMLRELGPEKRFEQGMRMMQMGREAWLADIKERNPHFSWEDVRREYWRNILTTEQFAVFYG